jgi:hypothetical protein
LCSYSLGCAGHWGMKVLSLRKPAEGVQLLRWNKKLPSASTQDPLGLNLRLSARLATQLLYCITSITPRARYYAFFPWAFQDYAEHEKGQRGDRGGVRGVLSREKAMVLGAVLHHDRAACVGGALFCHPSRNVHSQRQIIVLLIVLRGNRCGSGPGQRAT